MDQSENSTALKLNSQSYLAWSVECSFALVKRLAHTRNIQIRLQLGFLIYTVCLKEKKYIKGSCCVQVRNKERKENLFFHHSLSCFATPAMNYSRSCRRYRSIHTGTSRHRDLPKCHQAFELLTFCTHHHTPITTTRLFTMPL